MNFKEKYENFISKFEMVGSSVIVSDKDNIIASTPYGKQSLESNIDTSLNTIYRIASISKVIVAIAVLILSDEGKINIDDDISKYLGFDVRNPHFPNDLITVKMLMTQTSSICDSGNGTGGYGSVNLTDDEVLLKDILTNPDSKYYNPNTFMNHKPGTYWRYSNFGCGILACIIEKVSGQFFNDFIKERLLLPLDIKSGFRLEDLEYPNNLATHYLYDKE